MTRTLDILASGVGPRPVDGGWGRFAVVECRDPAAAAERLKAARADALLWCPAGSDGIDSWPALAVLAVETAVVVVASADARQTLEWLRAGVQEVLPRTADSQTVARALRLAVERKALERSARSAFATELSTGLPHQAQLLEHMALLLALREREPAPMALVVLRLEGLSAAAEALGVEVANVVRRKAAVRLRASLRASDVVAALGGDSFAVLLAAIDAEHNGEKVRAKLAQGLSRPYAAAGRSLELAVGSGLAAYPADGKDADTLLRRALAQAAAASPLGRVAVGGEADHGPAAANDADD